MSNQTFDQISVSTLLQTQMVNNIILTAFSGIIASGVAGGASTVKQLLVDAYDKIMAKYKIRSNVYTRAFEFEYTNISPSDNQKMYEKIIKIIDGESSTYKQGTHGKKSGKRILFAPVSDFRIGDVCINVTFKKQEVQNAPDSAQKQQQQSKTLTHCDVVLSSENINSLNKFINHVNDELEKDSLNKLYLFSTAGKSVTPFYNRFEFESKISFDGLYFDEKSKIVESLDRLKNGDIDRYNLLLHGEPGCGKSSLISAIINYMRWNATIIKLQGYDNDDLHNVVYSELRYMRSGNTSIHTAKNHIFIIEEIDHQTESVLLDEFKPKKMKKLDMSKKVALKPTDGNDDDINASLGSVRSKFSYNTVDLSCLLNILQGIHSPTRCIFIITTNFFNKLQPSLYRDGRIHLRLELKRMNPKNMLMLVKTKYPHATAEDLNFDQAFTPATIENTLLNTETLDEFIKTMGSHTNRMHEN